MPHVPVDFPPTRNLRNRSIRSLRATSALAVIAVVVGASACNESSPAVTVAPSSQPAPAPTPPTPVPATIALSRFVVNPAIVTGGNNSTAGLWLTGPATSGVVVAISSNHPSILVPNTLTIPSGSAYGTITIGTQRVTADVVGSITASLNGETRTERFTVTPSSTTSFLSFISSQGDWVGQGKTWRFEPGASAVFGGTMWNQNNQLTLSIATPGTTAGGWSLTIAAPAGSALSRGVYRNARRIPPIGSSDPQFTLSGEGRSCNTSTGEFEVLDATYGPPPNSGASGTIDYFRATFKQTCDGSPTGLTGEVRLVSIPLGCRVSGNC